MEKEQNNPVVTAEVSPSLKRDFRGAWEQAGFSNESETIRHLMREFIKSVRPSQSKSSEAIA